MNFKIVIFVLLVFSGITACNKSNISEFTDSPIVESYLRPDNYPLVKITRQIPFSSGVDYSEDNIDALSIKLTHNNTDFTLKPLGDGQYIDSSLIIKEGERYDISFIYNKKNVSAYTNVPTKPLNFTQSVKSISLEKMDSTTGRQWMGGVSMPEPLTLTWDNSDGSYYIVVIENMASTLVPIRDFGSRQPPGNRFRKAPTTASGLELMPMEFQYFGKHRLILYHVLPDYASLYSENQSSSLNLTNPSTSIINGYGIFTGLNSDTLFIDIIQLK
jgi:hypothetical protein